MTEQEQCPNCGRFMQIDADGFYDREWPYHETAQVIQYCDEQCCDQKRTKDREQYGDHRFGAAHRSVAIRHSLSNQQGDR